MKRIAVRPGINPDFIQPWAACIPIHCIITWTSQWNHIWGEHGLWTHFPEGWYTLSAAEICCRLNRIALDLGLIDD